MRSACGSLTCRLRLKWSGCDAVSRSLRRQSRRPLRTSRRSQRGGAAGGAGARQSGCAPWQLVCLRASLTPIGGWRSTRARAEPFRTGNGRASRIARTDLDPRIAAVTPRDPKTSRRPRGPKRTARHRGRGNKQRAMPRPALERYTIRLLIKHPDLSPEEIGDRVGLTPNYFWKRGELVARSRARPLRAFGRRRCGLMSRGPRGVATSSQGHVTWSGTCSRGTDFSSNGRRKAAA